MEKRNSPIQGVSFNTISFDKVKTVGHKGKIDKPKGGDLGELFKCTKALADATASLNEYLSGETNEFVVDLRKYSDALIKIQEGMLDMAKKKVGSIRDDAAKPQSLQQSPIKEVPPTI